MQAYIVLSTLCNLNCSHCIRNFTKKTDEQLSYKDVVSLLDEIYAYDKNTQIIITGGEPTIHKQFFEILSYATSLFKNVTICSNGVFSEKILQSFYKFPDITVQLSIDGSEKFHNLIRGSDCFCKVIHSLKELTSHNIKTIVSTTVNSLNIYSIPDLESVLNQFQILSWKIDLEQTFSKKEEVNILSIDSWNKFVDFIIINTKLPISIKKIFDFELFKKMEIKKGKDYLKSIANPNCGCCKTKYYVYPDLKVRICTCMDSIYLGDLRNEKISIILDSFPEKRKLFKVKIDSPCYNCEWLYICNGGCPGYSHYVFNKFGYGDIRCPKIKDYYGL